MSPGRRLLQIRTALIARRRLFWAAFAACAAVITVGMLTAANDARRAAAAWGVTVPVVVVLEELAPGEAITAVEVRDYPLALLPVGHMSSVPTDAVARQHLVAGQILSDTSLVATGARRTPARDGDVAVTISEQLPSGARTGDRVIVTSQGTILVDDALVLESDPPTIVLSVPRELGPIVAAAGNGELALLVQP